MFCLWWLYFDDFDGKVISMHSKLSQAWIYLHLPIHSFLGLLSITLTLVLKRQLTSLVVRSFLITGGGLFLFTGIFKYICSIDMKRSKRN